MQLHVNYISDQNEKEYFLLSVYTHFNNNLQQEDAKKT